MPDQQNSENQEPQNRSGMIRAVLEDTMRKRQNGDTITDQEVEKQYPELMPELGRQLELLRQVEEADARAMQTDDGEPIDILPNEDVAFLRKNMPGYEILERIEYGGQGVVYRAIQESTKRTVAIKVLLDGPLATERQRQRFAREVQLISRLGHPNIVSLYDSGTVGNRLFAVMEYIEGLPIDDYVELHGLSVREIVELVATASKALNVAHQHGIIHRDVKPSNILVDLDGRPHLLDFGLAKDFADEGSDESQALVSQTGQVIGTLPFLSPEQISGTEVVDVRSDLYSFGIILYRLLTGQFPYPVWGPPETVRRHILSTPATPPGKSARRPDADYVVDPADIDDDLDAVVLKAIEKDKAGRYQSVAAFADDLDRFLNHDAVEAKADRRLYLLKKTIRKYRVPVAVSFAFLLVLVGSLVGMTVLWRRAETVAAVAQAGLAMGSHSRLSGVERDAGRTDQAIAMLQKVIDIGGTVPSADPVICRFLYGAHHSLAEIYLEEKKIELAESHCREAVSVAEEAASLHPEDMEWQRQLAIAWGLEARMAVDREQWGDARMLCQRAASTFERIMQAHPNNESMMATYSRSMGLLGQAHRELGNMEEAWKCYMVARDYLADLVDEHPGNLDYKINLCYSDLKLAVWNMTNKSPEQNRMARERLEQLSATLQTFERPSILERDIRNISDAVEANLRILDRRRKAATAVEQ